MIECYRVQLLEFVRDKRRQLEASANPPADLLSRLLDTARDLVHRGYPMIWNLEAIMPLLESETTLRREMWQQTKDPYPELAKLAVDEWIDMVEYVRRSFGRVPAAQIPQEGTIMAQSKTGTRKQDGSGKGVGQPGGGGRNRNTKPCPSGGPGYGKGGGRGGGKNR